MNQKFLSLITEWNNNIERGAKFKLAKELNITRSLVSSWVANRQKPGEANIKKMSIIFQNAGLNVSEQDLNNLFGRVPKTRSSLEFAALYKEVGGVFLRP